MYSEEDLTSAVAAGVLDVQAADALRAHVEARRRETAVDEEHFRLLTGFNDIFVTIACLLVLGSFFFVTQHVARSLGAALLVVTSWGLAEFFTRRRRMALPSIVLVGAFAIGLALITQDVIDAPAGPIAACFVVALGSYGHWRRFRVPISVALGAAAIAFGCGVLITIPVPEAHRASVGLALAFVAGLMIFALALFWDSRDRARRTRRADVAFWLHLLAAPLIVHPVFKLLGIASGHAELGQLFVVLVLYVVLALISLAIDRRALMVSALAYVLSSFAALLLDRGLVNAGFGITAFTIGSALLLLSAFWHRARTFVLRPLPRAIRDRLATA